MLADRYGNLLTNLDGRALPGPAGRGVLGIGGARVRGLVGTYAERPRQALGAVVDSSGRVEVFVREGSARRRLGVGPGAPVSWTASRPASRRALPPRRSSSTRSSSSEEVVELAVVDEVDGVVEDVDGSLDFFSASTPFFRPSEG